ncbi:MAG: phospholipase D-like domain-containing protein [Rudaea sp.]|nr:phospholipase D-like domain-containing protein [Rudaea sp.]
MSVAAERATTLDTPVRRLAQQALSRAAGAPLIGGNSIELLIDAPANYTAWLAAMRAARRRILLENYIIRDDDVGRQFRAVLVERAEAGVKVHVICDWLGCLGQSRAEFWQPLTDAGGEMRRYNPFQLGNPVGWVNRDHRKLLVVDRDVAFLGGICISSKWLGDKVRGIAPWRDTAVGVRGPALAEFEQAFADVWAQLGTPLVRLHAGAPAPVGDIDLRVVATQPDTAGMFRLDQLIAAMARHSLWLADAYFVGLAPYVQALKAAARDGVDVRLLVPGASDLPVVRVMSRSGYRPLLENGVRVFEWNGAMMHAKTAVADGRWARVGSSNLNISSWMGNCELDVAVEDAAFAKSMEDQYLRDLENATEIVLSARRRVQRCDAKPQARRAGGSSGRAAAGALRLAHSMGAAFSNRRVLGQGEIAVLPWLAISLLVFAIGTVVWPRLSAWPLAGLAAWFGIALLVRYFRSRRVARDARVAGLPAANSATPSKLPP